MFKLFVSPDKYIQLKGTVLTYKTEQIKLVKGGASTFASVRYKYEYQNLVYESERITCDAMGRLVAHSSEPDKVASIHKLVDQMEYSKTVTVLIRENFPSRSCLSLSNSIASD